MIRLRCINGPHLYFFVGLLFCVPARGTIVVSLDSVVVPAGTTAIVGVYASSDSGDVISGFNLPLDINNDGFMDVDSDSNGDLPDGFALGVPALRNFIYANSGLDTPQPQIRLIGADGIPTGSGDNVTLSDKRTKLFELAVDVALEIPPGTQLPLQIIVPNDPFQALFNIAGPNSPDVTFPAPGQPALGSITVAIPEPSALFTLLGGAFVVGWFGRRYVRRRG